MIHFPPPFDEVCISDFPYPFLNDICYEISKEDFDNLAKKAPAGTFLSRNIGGYGNSYIITCNQRVVMSAIPNPETDELTYMAYI